MNVLDLFSGIGGISLGLERAGMRTVAFCECEPFARAILRKHWPDVPQYDDIRTLSAARLAADGIGVDVICGGFPCQDISSAGYKAGLSGDRSGLWVEYARLIRELRPAYVVVENVAALLNRGASDVLGDLAEIGYDAEWHCVSAAQLGASHHRDRFYLVAYPDSDSESDVSEHDEASRLSQVGGDYAAHTKRGERPLGWLLEGMRREWEPVTQESPWATEDCPIGMGMDDGLPARMDRLRCLGNSVLPQISEIIGRAIVMAEAARRTEIDTA
jgi:DNA (cytosine-5)-methyltransferase 1